MDVLHEFSKQNDNVDFAGKIIWKDVVDANGKTLRVETFNFGKYKDIPVAEVLHRDPGYYSWMLSSDFTLNTKQVLTRIRLQEFNKGKSF